MISGDIKIIIYDNSKTSIIILNRKLKNKNISNVRIYIIIVSARVRGIENNIHEIKKYIIYKIYFSDEKNKNNNTIIVKTALWEIYIIDDLIVEILIENDILILEEIDLLFSK